MNNFRFKAWDMKNFKLRKVLGIIFEDDKVKEVHVEAYNLIRKETYAIVRKDYEVKLLPFVYKTDKEGNDIYVGDILEVCDGECLDYEVESIEKIWGDRINTDKDCRIIINKYQKLIDDKKRKEQEEYEEYLRLEKEEELRNESNNKKM